MDRRIQGRKKGEGRKDDGQIFQQITGTGTKAEAPAEGMPMQTQAPSRESTWTTRGGQPRQEMDTSRHGQAAESSSALFLPTIQTLLLFGIMLYNTKQTAPVTAPATAPAEGQPPALHLLKRAKRRPCRCRNADADPAPGFQFHPTFQPRYGH